MLDEGAGVRISCGEPVPALIRCRDVVRGGQLTQYPVSEYQAQCQQWSVVWDNKSTQFVQ